MTRMTTMLFPMLLAACATSRTPTPVTQRTSAVVASAQNLCALLDDERSCRELGVALVNGRGITANRVEGLRLLTRACYRGLEVESCRALVDALSDDWTTDVRYEQALGSACAKGSPRDCRTLAVRRGDAWARRQLDALCAERSHREEVWCATARPPVPAVASGNAASSHGGA